MTLRTLVSTLLLALPLVLPSAGSAPLAQETSSGGIWRATDFYVPEDAALSRQEAQDWLGKPARISQTSIDFEGRTCRVLPEIERVRAGILLAAYQTTPDELGIPDQPVEVVDTGCDTPGFETMLGLQDGRFVLLYKGGFIFLEKNDPSQQPLFPLPDEKGKSIVVPEPGVSLLLPLAVAVLPPRQAPEAKAAGLGFWFESIPISRLPLDGDFPFNVQDALLLRAALAAAGSADSPPPPSLMPTAMPGSLRILDLGDDAWGLSYIRLHGECPCCPVFRQLALVFRNGWLTQLCLEASPQRIMDENPGYFDSFGQDADEECQGRTFWNTQLSMDKAFRIALDRGDKGSKGALHGLAQRWQQTFQALLQSIVLAPPSSPDFLQADHEPCRQATPSDGVLVPEQTFSLEIPGLGQVCLLTLDTPQGQVFRITTMGGFSALLDPAAASSLGLERGAGMLETMALGVDDLNADGLPDIIAIMQGRAPDGKTQQANRLFFSRPGERAQSAPALSWQGDPAYDSAVAPLPTVADVKLKVRSMRNKLRQNIGQNISLRGGLTADAPARGFLTLQPESGTGGRSLLLVRQGSLVAPDGSALQLPQPGQLLEITARVLGAENLFGPLRLKLAVSEAAAAPAFELTPGIPAQGPAPSAPSEP